MRSRGIVVPVVGVALALAGTFGVHTVAAGRPRDRRRAGQFSDQPRPSGWVRRGVAESTPAALQHPGSDRWQSARRPRSRRVVRGGGFDHLCCPPAPGCALPQRTGAHRRGCGLHVSEFSRSVVPWTLGGLPPAGVGRGKGPLHRRVQVEGAVRLVPHQPRDGDRAGRVRRGERPPADWHWSLQDDVVHPGRSSRARALRPLLRRARKERRGRSEGRSRRHDARARAAQGDGGSRRQRSGAGHRVSASGGGTSGRHLRQGH